MKLYTCGTCWTYDRGNATIAYAKSLDACKRLHDCWPECGIVEVESDPHVMVYDPGKDDEAWLERPSTLGDINLVRWIEPSKL